MRLWDVIIFLNYLTLSSLVVSLSPLCETDDDDVPYVIQPKARKNKNIITIYIKT